MGNSFIFSLLAAFAGVLGASASVAWAADGYGGLGLKPRSAAAQLTGSIGLRTPAAEAWQVAETGDVIYSGVREWARPGVRARESFSGVYFPLSGTWGGAIESGFLPASPLTPRRYSLGGQLHAALAAGGGLSVGLKYRVYETEPGLREYAAADVGAPGYGMAALRVPGASYGPSYQLQLSYHYNTANIFSLAVGREIETFTAGFDAPGNGPRLSLTGQHWLTPAWALSYDLLSNDPNSFRLQGLRLGVRYRF